MAAGDTLTHISCLHIDGSEAIPPTSFHPFTCLVELQIWSIPPLQDDRCAVDDCLSTVRDIRFNDMSQCLTFFTSLQFTSLGKVTFSRATSYELNFLESCGNQILDLEVSIFHPDGPHDCSVDLLRPCTGLASLHLGRQITLHCPKFLKYSYGNETLEILFISAEPGYPGDKQTNQEIDYFFSALDLEPGHGSRSIGERFPNLREIHFIDYEWPVQHRDIARDHLVRQALEYKERFQLDITDGTGKPFRPRVQRRRKW